MMPSERSVIYVFNEGGKFHSQPAKEGQSTQLATTTCAFGRHTFRHETAANKKRCSGCSRLDQVPVARCSTCTFALCLNCAEANRVLDHGDRNSANVETKLDEGFGEDRVYFSQRDKGLFPVDQTIQFVLLGSGASKDLAERLTIFTNSKLGGKENQVEHVTTREDLDLAWVVLKSKDAFQNFRLKCSRDQVVDLLDGWRVKWKVYVPPKTRRVYKVTGISDQLMMSPTLCSHIRRLIEDQLKMTPSEIDLVVEGDEGGILVVFAHGEHDVDFTRSLFTKDGHELLIGPTDATV